MALLITKLTDFLPDKDFVIRYSVGANEKDKACGACKSQNACMFYNWACNFKGISLKCVAIYVSS